MLLIAQPEVIEEVQGLFAVVAADTQDIEAQRTLGCLCWYQWVHSSGGQIDDNLHWAAALMLAPHKAGHGPFPEPLLPVLERINEEPERSGEEGVQALKNALSSFLDQLMGAAAELWSRKIATVTEVNSERSEFVGIRGEVLFNRFRLTKNAEYLQLAITATQEAVATTPEGVGRQLRHMERLCQMLYEKFVLTRNPKDVSTAISAAQEAVNTAPVGDAIRARFLNLLSVFLSDRARLTEGLEDLNAAVSVGREAVTASLNDTSHQSRYLANLCGTLTERYRRTAALEDLDAAVTAGSSAIKSATDEESRATAKHNLSIAAGLRANATRETFNYEDLAANSTEILNAYISVLRNAAEDNPGQNPTLLGNLLGARFERTGAMEDIDESIALLREGVADARTGDPDRAADFANLGVSLFRRFEQSGRAGDLDAAVAVTGTALTNAHDDHPARTLWLLNLGDALRARSERRETADNSIADLKAAAGATQEALGRTSEDDPQRARALASLTAIFTQRFERTEVLDDLNRAVSAGTAAIAAASNADPTDRSGILNNAGLARFIRFKQAGEIEDGNQAATILQEAVDATPQDHPARAPHLHNLGAALSERAKWRKGRADEASALADKREAAEKCAEAARVPGAAAWIRVLAARLAGSLLAETDPSRAADLLEAGVRLLPEIAPRQLDRASQQQMLSTFTGLASESAALALDVRTGGTKRTRAERALGLLEMGRAVSLSQVIETRSDLTDLTEQHHELAAKYIARRDHLSAIRVSAASASSTTHQIAAASRQDYPEAQRKSAEAFDSVLEEIRCTPGFEGFALPARPDELSQFGKDGPVAVINVAAHRCDAILIRPNDAITSVSLPEITPIIVTDKVRSFHLALHAMQRKDGSRDDREDAQESIHEILEWLWDAIADPILRALDLNGRNTAGDVDDWPHMWWVPCGLLSLLPIHAAGYHRRESNPPERDFDGSGPAPRAVIDRVVSSYAPSVRTLGYAREQNKPPVTPDQALIVAMPTTPGMSPLRNAAKEALLLKSEYFPDATLFIEDEANRCSSTTPTRGNVLRQLAHCSVVHFACHGISDLTDPAHSRLILHDHDSDALTVESLAAEHFHDARLAFLSACQTALNRKTSLIDEAIHMTSALQLSGFPHVIGTLWEVDDRIAYEVAADFYSRLRADNHILDTRKSAWALHHTVRTLRDQLRNVPSIWAAYLHVGA
ncbi:CHAT domain-containing protein [Streptomyces sp. NPDC050428]|uniref:CHAT domain-containing protein n=1 Tax=Streptomyces sp. NPDC050428 TaxID=3155757 RepID=UPI0034195A04